MLKVYEYERCGTCRKALKWLDARGIPYKRIAIVERPPSRSELESMRAAFGLSRLFNTSGQLYRELGLGRALKTMSEDAALSLLAEHGKLVKRPFAIGGGKRLVGFKEREWAAAFG